MLNKGMAIMLDNEQEYGVTETEIIDNVQYCLLINIENKKEIKICKVSKENNGIAVIELENEELKKVFPIFQVKAKDTLKNCNIDIDSVV